MRPPSPSCPSSLLLALTCASLVASAGCRRDEPSPSSGEAPPPVSLGAEDVAVAEVEMLESGPRVSGSLEPTRSAVVRAEVGGSVLEVAAELGETVEEGQVLARIEAQTLRDSVASAQASARAAADAHRLAERELERTRALVRGGALAERDLEAARNQVVAARSNLDEVRSRLATARAQLADATVEAPIDGVVAERAVNLGDVVAPTAPMFTVIDPSSMRLEASVPSDALSLLEVGTPVRFEVRGYPGRRFEGTLARIAPAADPVTRQISILVDVPNEAGELVAGLFAEGRVAAEQRRALVVPEGAVRAEGSEAIVATVRDGAVARVPVRLGLRDEETERVEVTEGLRAGDVVLLHGARDLAEGTPVTLPAGAADERPRGTRAAGTDAP